MSKRRFGVSIPEELAEELDRLAEITGSDRSSIIAEALKQYIHDHLHYLERHKCLGLLISIKTRDKMREGRLIDEFEDIIKNYIHQHIGRLCIEIFLVSGDSEKITKLHSRLRRTTPCVRYLPLGTILSTPVEE